MKPWWKRTEYVLVWAVLLGLMLGVVCSLVEAQVCPSYVRAWVIAYMKDAVGNIDTVYVHYTDSLSVKKLVADWGDIDTLNCDTLYCSGGEAVVRLYVSNFIDVDSTNTDHLVFNTHAYGDSLWTDDIVGNWADIDTLTGDTIRYTNAVLDTIRSDMYFKQSNIAMHYTTNGADSYGDTVKFYGVYKHGVIGGGQTGWSYIRSEGGQGDNSGDLVLDGGNITDGTAYKRGNVMIRSPLIRLTAASTWWNSVLDSPGWVEIWGGHADSSCIVVKTGSVTFGDGDNQASTTITCDGSTGTIETDNVIIDSLDVQHCVADINVTTDSVDAQHVVTNELNLTGCEIVYVPLTGDIQTYVDAADAGATLILASGAYTITDTINIDKQLNIVGQGNAGFVTTPVTPSHGTLITSSTANLPAFHISNDNVRITHLSINMTGAASIGVVTETDLTGLVLNNIDVIITATGTVTGFSFHGSNVVMRDLTFYITSTDGSAAGTLFWNNNTTTQDAICDCFNVTGTAVGVSGYAYSFACYNINDANTLTLNLSNSVCKALTGTAADVAVASYSTTTNNSTVNAYFCTFNGADYDAYQMGSNVINLGGSVLANGTVSGTVTYRTVMVSNTATVDSLDAQHVVADVHILTDSLNAEHVVGDFFVSEVTSCSIDSFKVNVAQDTLFFFVGGIKFAAEKP
uniref:Uncharacterized protein n=1 Tax=viral metagenome TaxID=1070528 RepID=A0A6H2A1F4_9ZZZZ